jgi:hypothetical protein
MLTLNQPPSSVTDVFMDLVKKTKHQVNWYTYYSSRSDSSYESIKCSICKMVLGFDWGSHSSWGFDENCEPK